MMKLRIFGASGLRVSELCLGTMTFGEAWGWGAAEETCDRMLRLFIERGGNFVDTACNYTDGQSEQILGRIARPIRDKLVIATKYTLARDKENPNAGGNHRRNLVLTVEESLRRLQTDHIDLLWVHMWDSTTPIEQVMRALDDQVRAGKVLHVGISDTPSWVVSEANAIAKLRGWSPFVGYQIPYSLADRSVERDALPMAKAGSLPVVAWGLLEGGVLTGKYNRDSDEPRRYRNPSERVKKLAEAVREIASARGHSPAQVAINWARQSTEATIIPLIGARTVEQLEDNLGSLSFTLETSEQKQLDEISKIPLGFPRDFLEDQEVQELIFGDTRSRLIQTS